MKKKPKINKIERLEISLLQQKGYGIREISRALDRSPSSISEEIRKNKVNNTYHPQKADHKAYVRRKYSKYQGMRINKDDELRKYIVDKLEKHWNPGVISGRMKKDQLPFYVSKSAIYLWLRTAYGQKYCYLLHSQRYYVKRRKIKKNKRIMIPNRVGIEKRPKIQGFSHYEGDTIVSGKKHKSRTCLSVVYNIKSKYVDLRKMDNLKPDAFNQSILQMKRNLKEIKTLTLDNGIENRHHYKLGIRTFFCNPYHSWEKGGIENVNRLIRRYVRKGSDIREYSDRYIRKVVNILNHKPRRSLNYLTPYEVMIKYNQLLLDNKKRLETGVRIEG